MKNINKAISVFAIPGMILLGGCKVCIDAGVCKQDPQAMADTVFSPIEAFQTSGSEPTAQDLQSLENAYQEGQVRLNIVRDTALRMSLSGVLRQKYEQRYQYLMQLAQAAEQKRIAEANARDSAETKARFVEAIRNIEVGMRTGNYDGYVLQLRNSAEIGVTFDLKCYRGSGYKTIFVSVAGRGSAEVGWMQGWPQNFHSGEYCEAIYEGQQLWTYRIP